VEKVAIHVVLVGRVAGGRVLGEFELVMFDDRDLVVVVGIVDEQVLDIVHAAALGIELAVGAGIVGHIPLMGDNRAGLVVRDDEISDLVEGVLFHSSDREGLKEGVGWEGQRMGYLHL
jgi:hypothetical protein